MEHTDQAVELVDIEEFAKAGKPVQKGKTYLIRIDNVKFQWPHSTITGKQLLELAGKDIQRFMIVERLRGGQTKRVALNESEDLTGPGIERFSTLPLDQTEGAR